MHPNVDPAEGKQEWPGIENPNPFDSFSEKAHDKGCQPEGTCRMTREKTIIGRTFQYPDQGINFNIVIGSQPGNRFLGQMHS